MKLVDLNLLLYAINRDAPLHVMARKWWEELLSANEPVALAWPVILGFIRISTNARILPRPLSVQQAMSLMDEWLHHPPVTTLAPTENHWQIFSEIIATVGRAGNLTTDAHLAALAVEHGATLCSTDNDFGRFPLVRWINPLCEG
ncbi:MAG: type II toxin-antitoxin system VapC family toxin [Thermodesulfobacteriota bacterium]